MNARQPHPYTRPATAAEIAAYRNAVAPLLQLPPGPERTEKVIHLRAIQHIYVNFRSGKADYRCPVRIAPQH